MKIKRMLFLISFLAFFILASCSIEKKDNDGMKDDDIEVIEKPSHNDYSKMTNRQMESAVNYKMNYRPSDGYVGDLMPYYENGTYYLFFLKDQGSSYNHSIFLVETKDFFNYEEKGEILRSGLPGTQDNWIGTGSLCKVGNTYYYFYTGHNENMPLHERIMVATSKNDLYHFKKLDGIYIDPTSEFNTNDFRDPDVTYDKENDKFILTVTTAAKLGGALIVKYDVARDLKSYTFDKILYKDTEGFWNMECSDTFKINNYWYLSYSGQDDTLWYAKSRSQYTGYGSSIYGSATRIEGKFFYAPKSVSDGINTYFVGWARRRATCDDSKSSSWAGNIVVSKIKQNSDGSITLTKIDNLNKYFNYKHNIDNDSVKINKNDVYEFGYHYDSFMLEGDFKYSGNKDFGFVFGLGKDESSLGHINLSPSKKVMEYMLMNKKKIDTEVKANFIEGKTYHFTLVSEGSVIVLYIDDIACITTRYYGKISTNFGFYTTGSEVEFSNLTFRQRG